MTLAAVSGRGRCRAVASPVQIDVTGAFGGRTVIVCRAGTRLRASGLFMALHSVLPQYRDSSRPASARSELPRYIALMVDRFTLAPNGDFQITHAELSSTGSSL